MDDMLFPYDTEVYAVGMKMPVDADDTEIPFKMHRVVTCQISDIEDSTLIELYFTAPVNPPKISQRCNRPQFFRHIMIPPLSNAVIHFLRFDIQGQFTQQHIFPDSDGTVNFCRFIDFPSYSLRQKIRRLLKQMIAFCNIHKKLID